MARQWTGIIAECSFRKHSCRPSSHVQEKREGKSLLPFRPSWSAGPFPNLTAARIQLMLPVEKLLHANAIEKSNEGASGVVRFAGPPPAAPPAALQLCCATPMGGRWRHLSKERGLSLFVSGRTAFEL